MTPEERDVLIKQYAALPASVGKTMPYGPKLGYNVGTQYSQPIADDLYVTARIDVHHKGRAAVSSGDKDKIEADVARLHAAGLWATMQRA